MGYGSDKWFAALLESFLADAQPLWVTSETDPGGAGDLLFGRLLSVLGGKVDSEDSVSSPYEEVSVRAREESFLLHHRIAFVPTSSTWSHGFFTFPPELRSNVIFGAPADAVIHREAENVDIEIFRPLNIHHLQCNMIDRLDRSAGT